MIYEFRYRSARAIVVSGHIEAPDLATATVRVRAWIAEQPQALLVENSVAPWLITPPAVVAAPGPDPQEVQHKPDLAEQKQRLQEAAATRRSGGGVGSMPREDGRVGT